MPFTRVQGLEPEYLLLDVVLDVLESEVEGLRLLSVRGDGNDGRTDLLLDVSVLEEAGKTGPLTEVSTRGNVDEGSVGRVGEGLDEALVVLLLAVLSQDDQAGLTALQSLDGLADTAGKSVGSQRLLQDDLERAQDIELLNLLLDDLNRGSNFSVIGNKRLGLEEARRVGGLRENREKKPWPPTDTH